MRRWSSYDASTARQIRPVSVWAELMSTDFVRRRLEPDYLANLEKYVAEFGRRAAAELGWT